MDYNNEMVMFPFTTKNDELVMAKNDIFHKVYLSLLYWSGLN
jgi:hypothetical protein